jgi:hypothetical protein
VEALEDRSLLSLSVGASLQPVGTDEQGMGGAGFLTTLSAGGIPITGLEPTVPIPVTGSLPAFQFQAAVLATPPVNGAPTGGLPAIGALTVTDIQIATTRIIQLAASIRFPDGELLSVSAAIELFFSREGLHLVLGPINIGAVGAGFDLSRVDLLIRPDGNSTNVVNRQWALPDSGRRLSQQNQDLTSPPEVQSANLRLEPVDLDAQGMQLSTSCTITLNVHADMRPGTPLGNLLPEMAHPRNGASLQAMGSAVKQVLVQVPLSGKSSGGGANLDSGTLILAGNLFPNNSSKFVAVSPLPPPSSARPSMIFMSQGGGAAPSPPASPDARRLPPERRRVVEDPYANEAITTPDTDTESEEPETESTSAIQDFDGVQLSSRLEQKAAQGDDLVLSKMRSPRPILVRGPLNPFLSFLIKPPANCPAPRREQDYCHPDLLPDGSRLTPIPGSDDRNQLPCDDKPARDLGAYIVWVGLAWAVAPHFWKGSVWPRRKHSELRHRRQEPTMIG